VSRLVLALAVAALALLAPSALAKPQVCASDAIQQRLIAAGKITDEDVKFGETVDLVRCGDITADGVADALFTVASGGTAGDIRFGVLRGLADGSPGKLVLYKHGYQVGISRRTSHAFETIMPHFGANDPNCCPSSFRIQRWRWNSHSFTAVGKAKKVRTAPRRFYRP
jgi:hypothetical protein